MVSGIPHVGITQNEHFLSCYSVLLGVRYIINLFRYLLYLIYFYINYKSHNHALKQRRIKIKERNEK
jgi:hypothetical protein